MASKDAVVCSADDLCSSSCSRELEPTLDDQMQGLTHPVSKTVKVLANPVPECLIERLPFEVVSYIFVLSLPRSFAAYNDFESAPLILGAVCRLWRDIAWSTPQLWNHIKIHLTPSSLQSKVEIACGWIRRSGQLPLSIRILLKSLHKPDYKQYRGFFALPPIDDSEWSKHFYPLIYFINKCSDRLCYLDLDGFSPWTLSESTFASPRRSSMLHTLKIWPTYTCKPRDGLSFCPGGEVFAPSVVKVSSMAFPSIGINWKNVTRLAANGFSVDECIDVVRRVPLLVYCKFLDIIAIRPDYVAYAADQQFTNLHIKVLVLRPMKGGMETFFHHISLPFLHTLDFGVEERAEGTRMPVDAVIGFLTRSSPPLRCLKILQPFFRDDGDLARICEIIPSLTKLAVSLEWLWDGRNPMRFFIDFDSLYILFTRLAEPWLVANNNYATNFLPKLKEFIYSGPRLEDVTLDLLPEAFRPNSETGNPCGRPFASLDLEFFNEYPKDSDSYVDSLPIDPDKLQELEDHGINIWYSG